MSSNKVRPTFNPDNPKERPEPPSPPRPLPPSTLPGAFSLTVSPEGEGEVTFPDLILFTAEGGVVESSPDQLARTGIGAWRRESESLYLVTLRRFIAEPSLNFSGVENVTLRLTLDLGGTLQGKFETLVTALDGGPVLRRITGTLQGQRL